MYTKILVPLDGSKLSEGILPHALSFAKALKIPVELIQVIEPEIVSTFSDPAHGRYVDIVEGDMKRNGIAYLEGVARSFPDSSKVQEVAAVGKPAEIIVDRAAGQTGSLVAMSTHGRSGIQRWLLGSVANKVLHATTNPLLLFRTSEATKTREPAPLKTILVPLDGSALAEKVFPYVVVLAKKMRLEVVLLQAYSPPSAAYIADEAYAPNLGAITEEVKQGAKDYLRAKVNQLRAEGLDNVSQVALEGNPADEIIAYAKQTPDNLVAMCTHGRSGVGRWILGSVTDRVVCHSGDPVLIIRASAA